MKALSFNDQLEAVGIILPVFYHARILPKEVRALTILSMAKDPKDMGRSTTTDALPHDVVVAVASVAASEAVKATIRGAQKIVEKQKAKNEKPKIILTDND
jgi:hypothetical protein